VSGDEQEPGVDLTTAWYQHAAAVESKLDRMAGAFADMVAQVDRASDPTRSPDPFAHVALATTATWTKSSSGGTVDDFLNVADRFEAWLRRPRPDGTP
jgi:hypothetical protein